MSDKKPDKYLTEMKELPPSHSLEEKEKESVVREKSKIPEKTLQDKSLPLNKSAKRKSDFSEKPKKSEFEKITENERKLPFTYKDVILGIVNLISIVFFIIILFNFPEKSRELRNLKIKEIKNNSLAGLETLEIEAARPKVQEINKLFLDEGGVVDFVNDVERQKSEGGAISRVTFASQKIVTDKTGNFGVPIVIELSGSWEAIDVDLQKIDKLPYLFRPIEVEITHKDEEESQVVVFKYGIFLYVRENLGQNR